MSHFTVLVIGENPEQQLQPFHEFECTGRNDQYVQNVSVVKEARKAYKKDIRTMLLAPDGALVSPYEDEFYRDPTEEEKKVVGMGSGCGEGISWSSRDWKDGKGYRAKVLFVPEGYTEKKVLFSSIESFADYIEGYYGLKRIGKYDKPDLEEEHKYGWVRVDEKGEVLEAIKRTNPNAKWDWYQLGGRWQGTFKRKPDALSSKVGEASLLMKDHEYDPQYCDQIRLKDLDMEGMLADIRKEKSELFDKVFSVVTANGGIPPRFKDVKAKYPEDRINDARKEYASLPVIKALAKDHLDSFFEDICDVFCDFDKEKYLQRSVKMHWIPFAIVNEGKWYERGEMGWWGCVSNEKDKEEWYNEVTKLITSLSPDILISMFDCHI